MIRTAAVLLQTVALTTSLSCHDAHAAPITAKPESSPFVLVMIDLESEKKLGAFPIDRRYIAKAINILADAKAKAVVLKFFYDRPAKNPASDTTLVSALQRTKVLLQARIDDAEASTNALPERFYVNQSGSKTIINGKSGWVPLPTISAHAHQVGFVDVSTYESVPMFERYQGKLVKSLTLAAIQTALDDAPISLQPGKDIGIGNKRLVIDARDEVVLSAEAFKRPINALPLHDLLAKRVDVTALAGKVVVIAYDGEKMKPISTKAGEFTPHRLFWLGLLGTWQQLSTK